MAYLVELLERGFTHARHRGGARPAASTCTAAYKQHCKHHEQQNHSSYSPMTCRNSGGISTGEEDVFTPEDLQLLSSLCRQVLRCTARSRVDRSLTLSSLANTEFTSARALLVIGFSSPESTVLCRALHTPHYGDRRDNCEMNATKKNVQNSKPVTGCSMPR